MASPRCRAACLSAPGHGSRRRSPRAVVSIVAAAGAAAALFAVVPAGVGVAASSATITAAQAQSQLQALSTKAEILTEQYDAASDKLAADNRELGADRDQVAAAQRQVDAFAAQVDAVAVSAYEAGSTSNLSSLLESGDPQATLQRSSTLALLSARRDAQLRTATAARDRLDQAQAGASQQLQAVAALQASLKAQQKVLDSLVAQQNALLAVSQAQEQADQRAAASRAAAQAQQKITVSRSQPRTPLTHRIVPQPAKAQPVYNGPADGRAAAALKYAYAQLGKPYRYGGAGASTFDCSGLTMRAWQAAGVALSHNAAAQYSSTPHVSKSALEPGDLVYFGRPIHHVGIYIGGGKFIEAPYTGADIRISSLGARSDFAGASRP